MAHLTNTQQLTLYALGLCSANINRRFKDKPLEASVSKVTFIETMLRSDTLKKKTRALYKNIETLEKMKLITYKNRQIRFTKRGYTKFSRIQKEIEPYLHQHQFWNSPLVFDRNIQARLK